MRIDWDLPVAFGRGREDLEAPHRADPALQIGARQLGVEVPRTPRPSWVSR
jgi:hypothetical protein